MVKSRFMQRLGPGRTLIFISLSFAFLLCWSWSVRLRSVHVESVYGESSAKAYTIQCTVVNPRSEDKDVHVVATALGYETVGRYDRSPCVLAEESRDLSLRPNERRSLTFEFERNSSFRLLSGPQVLVSSR